MHKTLPCLKITSQAFAKALNTLGLTIRDNHNGMVVSFSMVSNIVNTDLINSSDSLLPSLDKQPSLVSNTKAPAPKGNVNVFHECLENNSTVHASII